MTENMDRVEELYKRIQSQYEPPRPALKRNIARVGFIRYLFRERGRILKWNASHGLINPGFLGLSPKLGSGVRLALSELYVTYVLPVAVHLPEIIENGWQHQVLTIKEYNLIVCFEDFCTKLESTERDRELMQKHFRLIENSFFRIVSEVRNIHMLLDGLLKIFDFYRKKLFKREDVPEELLSKLSRFFFPNGTALSLYDVIAAVNIAETRRFLTFPNIIMPGIHDLIPAHFYACEFDVFSRIVKYLEGLLRDLRKLEDGKRRIDWLRRHTSITFTASPSLLVGFYESLGHMWQRDSNDVILLLLLLLDGIVGRIETALSETWKVMDTNERIANVKLISNDEIITALSLARRELELARQKHSVTVPGQISLSDYLESKVRDMPYSGENQSYILKKVELVFSALRVLAEHFDALYEKRNGPGERILNFMIVAPEKWRGKPVYDLYLYYVDLILCTCGYFREQKLVVELNEEPEIDKNIGVLREKIKWTKDANDTIIKAITSKEWGSDE
jgi:hypothetical protein